MKSADGGLSFNRLREPEWLSALPHPGTEPFVMIEIVLHSWQCSWWISGRERPLADGVGIEGGAVMIERPQPTRQFVRERDGGFVVALALLQVERPGLQGIEWLAGASSQGRRAQHRAATVDKQGAQVAVAALGDLSEPPLLAGRMFAGHQAQPGGQVDLPPILVPAATPWGPGSRACRSGWWIGGGALWADRRGGAARLPWIEDLRRTRRTSDTAFPPTTAGGGMGR